MDLRSTTQKHNSDLSLFFWTKRLVHEINNYYYTFRCIRLLCCCGCLLFLHYTRHRHDTTAVALDLRHSVTRLGRMLPRNMLVVFQMLLLLPQLPSQARKSFGFKTNTQTIQYCSGKAKCTGATNDGRYRSLSLSERSIRGTGCGSCSGGPSRYEVAGSCGRAKAFEATK